METAVAEAIIRLILTAVEGNGQKDNIIKALAKERFPQDFLHRPDGNSTPEEVIEAMANLPFGDYEEVFNKMKERFIPEWTDLLKKYAEENFATPKTEPGIIEILVAVKSPGFRFKEEYLRKLVTSPEYKDIFERLVEERNEEEGVMTKKDFLEDLEDNLSDYVYLDFNDCGGSSADIRIKVNT